ncbi:MAG: aspartate 1-decarboxylase [Bacillota bacterium]|jgi:aspartate 1-decarboxylase
MYINMLKSKIHRAIVTEANLNYVGSITIDEALMAAADIHEMEKVQVLNINNGTRIETYAMPGPAASGQICLNGAAARLFHPGDLVIILTYCWIDEKELDTLDRRIIHVDENNKIIPE